MSFPDINDLSTAFTLCNCTVTCSRHCAVCQSPTWREQGCVREQFEALPHKPTRYVSAMDGDRVVATAPIDPDGTATFALADVIGNVPMYGIPAGIPTHNAPGPDGIVCENGCDAWSVDERCVQHGSKPAEAMIDMLEEQGYPLQPWQAEALRALLRRP